MLPATDQRDASPGSFDWLTEELSAEAPLIKDEQLRTRVFEWLREVAKLPGGDMLDIVDQQLTEIRQKPDDDQGLGEFAMRRVEGDGEANFPDSCKGCEHYGTRCPVFVDPLEQQRRDQLQTEYADANTSEKRRAYRRYGETVGCHQITGALADYTETYQELRTEGLNLLEEVQQQKGFAVESEQPDTEAEGGP
jgi:hypothetical protein